MSVLRYQINATLVVFSIVSAIGLIIVFVPLANTLLSHSPQDLANTLQVPKVYDAIGLSVYAALLTAIAALILGVPLAYILARKTFPGKSFVESLVDLPLVVPHTVAGIALLLVWGRTGIFGAPLYNIFNIQFYGTLAGIVIAMLFVSSPFMINSVREGFESIDRDVELAARSLGASQFEVFRRISLPLAFRGIMVGALLVWARAISEFGAVYIIAYYPMAAPILIADQYLQFGLKASSAIAALLLMITLIVFVVLRFVILRKRAEK